MAALLTVNAGSTEKIQRYIANCNSMGIEVLPPDVNSSGIDFTPKEDQILFGLSAVRNLGEGAIRQLIKARNEDGNFSSLADLCDRIPTNVLNRRNLESLIHSGAVDVFDPEGNRAQLMADLDLIIDWAGSRARDRESGQGNLFDLSSPTSDQKDKLEITSVPKAADVSDYHPTEKLRLEKELLGFYLSDHPLKQLAESAKLIAPISLVNLESQSDKSKVSAIVMIKEMRVVTTRK